jgi:spore maturation protein B
VAIISVKLLEKLPMFRISPSDQRTKVEEGLEKAEVKEETGIIDPGYSSVVPQEPARRLSVLGLIAPIGLALFFIALFIRMVTPNLFGLAMAPDTAAQNIFVRSVNALSILAIPFLLSFFPLYAAVRGVKVYEEFVEGAKEGFGVILKIIPFLVTMLVAIGMFKGAGGIDLLSRMLSPILSPLQFPPDLLPLALMRPLSGSATLALLTDIVHRLGPDNIVSLTAATIYGSTETTFYVAAVYFGAVGIKQTRHAIPAGLLADLTGVIASVVICRAVLG